MPKRKSRRRQRRKAAGVVGRPGSAYAAVLEAITDVLETARRASSRAVNTIMTATYWDVGRRIVELEQRGHERAHYGEELLARLAADLTERFGRGFSERNIRQMRLFYLGWRIRQTLSAESRSGRPRGSRLSSAPRFPLPWSHYVRLLAVKHSAARQFYEAEALRGGWSVRQLDRQIASQFYQRTALSRNKAALASGSRAQPNDALTPEEEIKDPFVLEFLGLKDEYSESDLQAALISQIETVLLEFGGDFAFVGRERRLRAGDAWYRVDLIFYHRRLRCLVIVDLKLGKLTHADAGQMHLYLNYAREHWTHADENPPVGLILCAEKDSAIAHYALDGLPNKVVAAEYRTTLPGEQFLISAIARTRKALASRASLTSLKPLP
ncbi:MAG: PDDEXK nuclease domain-containing protein [Gemmatimonadaceae bacterium]